MYEARRRGKGAEDGDLETDREKDPEEAKNVRGWKHLNPENVRLYLTMTLVALIVLHGPVTSLSWSSSPAISSPTEHRSGHNGVGASPHRHHHGSRNNPQAVEAWKAQQEEELVFQKGLMIEEDEEEEEELPPSNEDAEKQLQAELDVLLDEVNIMHTSGMVMETEPIALKRIQQLQDTTRSLLQLRYGEEPYQYKLVLQFPSSHPEGASSGELLIEMAPMKLMPHAVYLFMTMAAHWEGGMFHRYAPHVLQAAVQGNAPHLAFQEYSAAFPHDIYTLGYAGRPGGPAFYISLMDNKLNHGPGSQGSETEADSCFAKVVRGVDVIKRLQRMPGADPANNFFAGSRSNHVQITVQRVLAAATPDGSAW